MLNSLPDPSRKLLMDLVDLLAITEDPVKDGTGVDFLIIESCTRKYPEQQDSQYGDDDADYEGQSRECDLQKDHSRMKDCLYYLLDDVKSFDGDSGADSPYVVHTVIDAAVDYGSEYERGYPDDPSIPGGG